MSIRLVGGGGGWTAGGGDGVLLWIALFCGVAAILGHVRPVFLRFGRGGKGVATATGVFLALAPIQTASAIAVFATAVLTSGYVSLGSLLSAALLPVLLAATVGLRSPLFAVGATVATFVFWTHRANIGRLHRGEEHRFGKRDVRRRTGLATTVVGVVIALAVMITLRFA